MKQYGDLELIDSQIVNLRVESLNSLPSFASGDESRLVYNSTNHQLYYNNGTSYVPVQVASQTAQPLIATLGSNWINNDYSFNPVPFNTLASGYISGLTSSSSLYNVIQQIDAALDSLSTVSINSIQNFAVSSPQAGDILYFNGSHFINVPISNVPNFGIQIALGNLSNVTVDVSPVDNESLFFDSSVNKFVSKKTFYKYTNLTPGTTFTVVHNLGFQCCTVAVFNVGVTPYQLVTPTAVAFNSTTQLTITTPSSMAIIAYVGIIPVQNS